MNKLPKRWLPYKPIGNVIEGTRFIAFKVPLDIKYMQSIPISDHFTPQILLSLRRDIGLIIDLTATNRYYNKEYFKDNNIQYVKIHTEGRQVPSHHVFSKFKIAVNTFLESNKHNDLKIGVHCTHGLNRTGYLICKYMITEMNMKSNDAIQIFARCRGHGIEHNHYICSLKSLDSGNNLQDVDHNTGLPRSSLTSYSRKRRSEPISNSRDRHYDRRPSNPHVRNYVQPLHNYVHDTSDNPYRSLIPSNNHTPPTEYKPESAFARYRWTPRNENNNNSMPSTSDDRS